MTWVDPKKKQWYTKSKKPAESTLKKKHDKTLDMLNAMRNKKDGKGKTTINVKKTTVTHGDDADPF